MTRWEYLFEDVHVNDAEQNANINGADGWELVSAELRNTHWYCVFKRPSEQTSVGDREPGKVEP